MQKVQSLDAVGHAINHNVVGMNNDFPGTGYPTESIKVGMSWKG
jgi:hypothetical protein